MKNSANGACHGCQHFLINMQACGLHFDGIYLPQRAYLLTYCLTSRHKECSTFKRFCFLEKYRSIEPDDGTAGRRRYPRIEERWKVIVQACDPSGKALDNSAIPAYTVDYSEGGMRIVVDDEISGNSQFLFKFEDDFVIPGFNGIAQVCWHRRLDDAAATREAGFSFNEAHLCEDHFLTE